MRVPVLLALLAVAAPSALRAQAPWAPDAPVMKLDEVGLYRVGYAYRGKPEVAMPYGWSGHFDEQTGISCRPSGSQAGRAAFLLHCPWRGGTGIAFQEFAIRVPRVRRAALTGAVAMLADIVGKSDGAVFRVRANGKVVFEALKKDAEWRPFRVDLTPFAGRTLTLRFETDPGPADDSGFDYSLWGDRTVSFEGYRPAPVKHPPPPPLDLRRVLPVQRGGAVPPNAFGGANRLERRKGGVTFHYAGPDGSLQYRWDTGGANEPFGRFSLVARPRKGPSQRVPLAGGMALEWGEAARLVRRAWSDTPAGRTLALTYEVGGRTATVRLAARIAGKSLVLSASCDRPGVALLDAGSWGPVLRRRPVTVPYYFGRVHYLQAQGLFVNAFLDWTASSASAHESTRATYRPLTDGTRAPLAERAVYTAGWHMAEVLPNIPNPPSPYLKDLSRRVVLDIWGGRYDDIARDLQNLHDYGVRDCVAIIHVWQRSGYDNALPMHIPALADLGGDEGMRRLVQTGVRLNTLMALHENYVDYYPNYDHFDPDHISLQPDGSRENAWYNPGTRIQSFAVKPNAILPLARTQSPEIHRRYGTNANYLDVHSAVPPWFHVDFRAGEEGAGTFRRVWDVHRDLWNYEREVHGGPTFGEGNNHAYWSGLLDGAEAQFGVGWPGGQGMAAPLMVDFDLLKVHPLQFNHGMGYYERWWSAAPWGSVPPMVVLDQYRMQEVAYGHAGFLAASNWSTVPHAWLEHHLLRPVMERYGAEKPARIAYQVGGRWVDPTAAAIAATWDRVRVTYGNGLTVTANNAKEPLRLAGGVTLPQFGWHAAGAGVTAWTALMGGVVADYAETADSVFANARPAADWSMTGFRRIRPTVRFEPAGPRAFRATYTWKVGETLEADYNSFVHFLDRKLPSEGIAWQQDHGLPRPTSEWRPGDTVTDGPHTIAVPDGLPDGDYVWVIGLWNQSRGRVGLEGAEEGSSRIRLGSLAVRGGTVEFRPETDTGDERAAWHERHVNVQGKPIDFGPVRTDGSVLVRREGGEWVLRAFPRTRPFLVELSAARFGAPQSVRCVGGEGGSVRPERVGPRWSLPLNGASEYRWPAR